MRLLRGLVQSPFLEPVRAYSEAINKTYIRGTQANLDVFGIYQVTLPGRWARMIGISVSVIVLGYVSFGMFVSYCGGEKVVEPLQRVYICNPCQPPILQTLYSLFILTS